MEIGDRGEPARDQVRGGVRAIGAIWLILLVAACGARGPLADLEPGERGRVVRVVDGDTIVLDTGQSVRLVGIEAPSGGFGDRDPQPFHTEAKRMMEDMVLGRQVQLHYGGLTRDRYDRALAHAETVDALGPRFWLNAEIVKRGGARVRVYPDTSAANAPLFDLERDARENSVGMWSTREYRIPLATDLPDTFEGFQLIYGNVADMQGSDGFGAVCDLSLEGSHLRLQIQVPAAGHCQSALGANVLARGFVRDGVMEISDKLNLQIMSAPPD
ncbi:thermonuclease family protein [Hyphomonas atlantica]|uniref:thermonuclease family protein n=1 Tax=Hyphomonas atlantica TaxID=1280948 RepID=UPI0023F40F6B|nr:thermonuclease family protein [Hyphomonas atlantica]